MDGLLSLYGFRGSENQSFFIMIFFHHKVQPLPRDGQLGKSCQLAGTRECAGHHLIGQQYDSESLGPSAARLCILPRRLIKTLDIPFQRKVFPIILDRFNVLDFY